MVDKDQFCINKKPQNETIVVGKNNVLVNAFVYVRLPLGTKIDVHPAYQANLQQPVTLDNNGCMFSPRAFCVRLGQELAIKNSDPVGHNTNIYLFGFNQVVAANETLKVKANKDQGMPAKLECNLHKWMNAYMLCQDHPYMAVTGQNGEFEIKDIPAGEHNFQFWHETGYLRDAKFKGGVTDAKKGQAKIKIVAGQLTDLGDVVIKAGSLRP